MTDTAPIISYARSAFLSLTALFIFTLTNYQIDSPSVIYSRPEVALLSNEVTQGDMGVIELKGAANGKTPEGEIFGTKLRFFTAAGSYIALTAAGMEETSGTHMMTIHGIEEHALYYPVKVAAKEFDSTILNVKRRMAFPGKKERARIKRENELVASAIEDRLKKIGKAPAWDGPFIMPVTDKITDTFGSWRVMNKKKEYRHNGLDIRAKNGARVVAANSGEVVLTGDFYLTGKTVIVDHGMGVFTTYAHLSRISADIGEKVERGQLVGRAGATGRATGPHLHWGARLEYNFINPESIVTESEAFFKHISDKR
ncbi:MAG: M23 family metallopeptidase [Deltaproteobacteria bacterium]|nr:M23 family metallopeptidase [Deltaproteobacteria bacterium]